MKKILIVIVLILFLASHNTRQAKAEEGVAGIAITLDKIKDIENVYPKNEITVLYRIVEAEATGENIDSKKNVASVILNRTKNKDFPDTITDVVFQHDGDNYQFSPIKDKRYWSVEVTKETIMAVDDVITAGANSEAIYFCNLDKVSERMKKWFGSLKFLFKDDSNQSYYK